MHGLARLAFLLALLGTPAMAAHVVISCGSMGVELETCRTGAEAWAKRTGNSVEVLASPASSGERLAQMQLLLAAKSPDIDVFLVDTTWPGILGDFFLDLSGLTQAGEFFASFVRNNRVGPKLVALPWFIDAGLLFYRKDLLAKYGERPPETWKELTRIAGKIQAGERQAGNPRFWGYVFQGRAYEGLSCNGLEWIESSGGGGILDEAGRVTVNNPNAAAALALAASWVGSISPRGVLNYMEEESRGVFQSGNAAFLRNWPYVWKLANAPDSPVRGKVGMKPLPRGLAPGSNPVATLGGWSLAVSRHSRNPQAAMSLVRYLTGSEEQKRRTLVLGQYPTIPALYRDPALVRERPELPELYEVFSRAVARPSAIAGPRYNRASAEMWESYHQALSGERSAGSALEELAQRLEFLSRGGKW